MTGSMRTFVTDGQTDRLTDGAGYIRTRWASPNNRIQEFKMSVTGTFKVDAMLQQITEAVHKPGPREANELND